MSYSIYRRPLRHLEYTVASGYTLLKLIGEKELTKKKALYAGGLLSLQLAAIYYTDKLVAGFITRGYAAATTKTLLGVQAIYIGGAVASVLIDDKEGLDNYNEFIDDVVSGDGTATSFKISYTATVLLSRFAMTDEFKATDTAIELILDQINPF